MTHLLITAILAPFAVSAHVCAPHGNRDLARAYMFSGSSSRTQLDRTQRRKATWHWFGIVTLIVGGRSALHRHPFKWRCSHFPTH